MTWQSSEASAVESPELQSEAPAQFVSLGASTTDQRSERI